MSDAREAQATALILVMAAGQSRRFGSDKRLARLPRGSDSSDTSLLAATLARVMSLEMPWRLVLREDDDVKALLGERFARTHGSSIWRAPHAALGLGASLGDAFRQLAENDSLEHIQSATVWLADMPAVAVTTVQTLRAHASEECIVRPVFEGAPGHPVVFGRRFWPELAMLECGGGAREVIACHRDCLHEVAVCDAGIHRDVDTPAMLAGLYE